MASNGGNARMFLARELRRAREAKGMNRLVLAKAFYVSESLIKQWETGRRVPTADDMEKLDELFGKGGTLVRLREDLVKASVPVEWFGRWAEIESRATSLWTFEPMVVPGLLQTEDYARAILRAANHLADVEEMVAARMERQRILTGEDEDEDPPMFIALIAESVLRHNVGGSKVMTDQLGHLAEVAERDNVIIQIIPDSATVCAGYTGPFVIARFDGGNDVAYIDNALSGEVIEDADGDLVRLQRMLDVFRSDALSRPESISLIKKATEQWKL